MPLLVDFAARVRRHREIIIEGEDVFVSADFNPKHLRLYAWKWQTFTGYLWLYEFNLM